MTELELKACIEAKFYRVCWFADAIGIDRANLVNMIKRKASSYDAILKLVEETDPILFRLKQPELRDAIVSKKQQLNLSYVDIAKTTGLKEPVVANAARALVYPNSRLDAVAAVLGINVKEYYL